MDVDPLERRVGPVRLGMTRDEVLAALGREQTYEEWMGGNLNDSLLYPGLILGFDRCDARGPLAAGRLDEVHAQPRPDWTMWGRPVRAWTRPALTEHLRERAAAFEEREYGDVFLGHVAAAFDFDEAGALREFQLWEPAR